MAKDLTKVKVNDKLKKLCDFSDIRFIRAFYILKKVHTFILNTKVFTKQERQANTTTKD